MKTITILFIFLGSTMLVGASDIKIVSALMDNNSKAINTIDTVVFDLSNATLTSSYIDIPVSFLSDDTVDALDFKFKIDETKLTYDSVINLNPDLSALAYFNPDDRFLRLTSYSLYRIPNNTIQLSLRFIISTSTVNITNADFDSIAVYLNGEPCSYKIKGRAATGIIEAKNDNIFSIFPNPTTQNLTIIATKSATAELVDVTGKQVLLQENIIAGTKKEINVENIANGIYMMKVFDEHFVSVKKVVINK